MPFRKGKKTFRGDAYQTPNSQAKAPKGINNLCEQRPEMVRFIGSEESVVPPPNWNCEKTQGSSGGQRRGANLTPYGKKGLTSIQS